MCQPICATMPLPICLAGLIEQHDRSRFETIAISFGADPGSKMQARLKSAFERFIDVSDKSDVEIANLLRRSKSISPWI